MARKKSERRILAEKIAKQRGIKVDSAMRYLQRAAAPKGKQRINKPTFKGLTPSVKKKAKQEINKTVSRRKAEQEKVVVEKVDRSFMLTRSRFIEGVPFRIDVKATWQISSVREDRIIRGYASASEAKKVYDAENFDEALQAWLEIEENDFLGQDAGKILQFEYMQFVGSN